MEKAISSGSCKNETGDKVSLIKKAIWLSWFTIIYNLLEGFISIGFGLSDDSISLAGFGVDSLIEVASAALVLWRFRGETGTSQSLEISKERKATFGIGILFVSLATLTAVASTHQLISKNHPETTFPGVVISILSLSFMFFLWRSKLGVARALQSRTVEKDAHCSRACIQLSCILFVGSILYWIIPELWWVDGAAGVLLSVMIGKEGLETIQSARSKDFSGGCGCH